MLSHKSRHGFASGVRNIVEKYSQDMGLLNTAEKYNSGIQLKNTLEKCILRSSQSSVAENITRPLPHPIRRVGARSIQYS